MTPQQNKILNALKAGRLTTADFMARQCPSCGAGKGLNIVNFSQRITELKRMGYDIRSRQLKRGLWEYWLEAREFDGEIERDENGKETKVLSSPMFPDQPKPPNPYGLRS